MNKISPYSNVGIHKAIYHLILEEWSGLSSIESNNNGSFSNLIDDVIKLSMVESELFFDTSIIKYIEKEKINRMAIKKESSTTSFETKEYEYLKRRLKLLDIENKMFNFEKFNEEVYKYIKDKYKGFENIKPKKLHNINEENITDFLRNINQTKNERLNAFNGLSFKRKESFHFVDAITAPVVYYNKTNSKEPIQTLIMGISSYVLKLMEVKNTKLIIKKLEEIISKDLKINDEKFNFGQFSYNKKSDSIKEKKESQIKNDIDRILNR